MYSFNTGIIPITSIKVYILYTPNMSNIKGLCTIGQDGSLLQQREREGERESYFKNNKEQRPYFYTMYVSCTHFTF